MFWRNTLITIRKSSTVPAGLYGPNNNVSPFLYNRNPRNLERMRIAIKLQGYALDDVPKDYWHRIVIEQSKRHSTAYVEHLSGTTVVSASTNEWAIKKFLRSTLDLKAMETVGKVLAQRCLESGILEVHSVYDKDSSSKVRTLLKSLEDGGVSLTEPERFYPHRHFSREVKEKPWEVFETSS